MINSHRALLALLLASVTTAAPVAGQDALYSCSSYLAQNQSTRIGFTSGLIIGFGMAVAEAGQVRAYLASDTTTSELSRRIRRSLYPEADPDSLDRIIAQRQTGRTLGAELVVGHLKRMLQGEGNPSKTELSHLIAARCSRPENSTAEVGVIFLELLRSS